MTTTVGVSTHPFDVYVRPRRTGWRRLWPVGAWHLGTIDLTLPVHAEASDGGDVMVSCATSPEIATAVAAGLRGLADKVDRFAADASADYR